MGDVISNLLAFGFAAPAMLGWLAVAAAPLLIHWLFRRHYREVTWAAMQFLQEAVRKQSRRTRFEHLLLLAVRLAVLVLIVLAVARPQWADADKLAKGAPPTLRVLVIDASLSMGRAASDAALGKTLFDVAKRTAKEAVQRALPGDRFVLARIAGSEPRVLIRQPTLMTSAVLDDVDRLPLTFERGDVSVTLTALRDIVELKQAAERCEVVVISDFQETSFRTSTTKSSQNFSPNHADEDHADDWRRLADKAAVTLIDVGAVAPENGTVVSLAVDPPMISAEQTMSVMATIRNNGSAAITGRRVEMLIDEQLADSRRIDVPWGQDAIVEFTFRAPASGEHGLSVRLEDDSLPADNQRWLPLSVRSDLSILLVNGRSTGRARDSATFFVEQALSPISLGARDRGMLSSVAAVRGLRVSTITEADLANMELARHDVVFLCDTGLLTDADVERLRRFMEAGGGVIVSLGSSVNLERFNEVVSSPRGLISVRLQEPISGADENGKPTVFGFDPGDYLHPLLREFRGNPGAGLEAALIQRYVRAVAIGNASGTSSESSLVESAINFSSGDPAVLTSSRGTGRCVLITTSLDETWGEWAIWAPGFVPLVHELVQYAAAGRSQPHEQLVGETILRKLHGSAVNEKITLTRPNGDRQALSAQEIDGTLTVTVAETPTPGLYLLSSAGEVNHSERIAINVDPRESDTRRFDPVEFSNSNALRGKIATRDATSTVPVISVGSDVEALSLARGLLLAVLSLLLIEQGLAWRFTFGMTVALIVVCLAGVALLSHWKISLLVSIFIVVGVSVFTRFGSLSKMLGRKQTPLEGR